MTLSGKIGMIVRVNSSFPMSKGKIIDYFFGIMKKMIQFII